VNPEKIEQRPHLMRLPIGSLDSWCRWSVSALFLSPTVSQPSIAGLNRCQFSITINDSVAPCSRQRDRQTSIRRTSSTIIRDFTTTFA